VEIPRLGNQIQTSVHRLCYLNIAGRAKSEEEKTVDKGKPYPTSTVIESKEKRNSTANVRFI